MPRGDRLDDAAFYGFIDQFPRRPVGHGAAALLGRLTRDSNDLRQLLGAECRSHTSPWPVAQNLDQQLPQVPVAGILLLGCTEPFLRFGPPLPPSPRKLLVRAQLPTLCSTLLTPSADIKMIRHRSMSRYGVPALFRIHFSRSPRSRSETLISTALQPIKTSVLHPERDPRGSKKQDLCKNSAQVI